MGEAFAMRVEPNAKDMARGGALLRNPDLRTGMGAAAQARTIKEFSPNAYGRKLNSFFGHEVEPRLETGMNRVAN
ncbi:hypothetical protein [Leisingera sp. F5]|uniref:hypothetical protein n=1 Tax=Leisingera sp. F5 TaxID=1813816 RepID=UPI0025BBF01B|nr:hypothetical protein [Leisingera sp. F5]